MNRLATLLDGLSNFLYTADWFEVENDIEHSGHGRLSRMLYYLCRNTFLSRYWLS